jgi:hypothetical protein
VTLGAVMHSRLASNLWPRRLCCQLFLCISNLADEAISPRLSSSHSTGEPVVHSSPLETRGIERKRSNSAILFTSIALLALMALSFFLSIAVIVHQALLHQTLHTTFYSVHLGTTLV